MIFDAVGTLIEPRPAVAFVYAAAAARQGVKLPHEVVRARFRAALGRAYSASACHRSDEAIEAERWRNIVAECLPEVSDHDRAFRELWDHFGSPSAWRVFSDVEPALDALRGAGLRIGVASNFDARLFDVLRGHAAVSSLAEDALTCTQMGWRKPHRAFYEAIGVRLRVPLASILYVGDDPEHDAEAPRRFGLQSLRIERGRPSEATIVGDLREIVKRIV